MLLTRLGLDLFLIIQVQGALKDDDIKLNVASTIEPGYKNSGSLEVIAKVWFTYYDNILYNYEHKKLIGVGHK